MADIESIAQAILDDITGALGHEPSEEELNDILIGFMAWIVEEDKRARGNRLQVGDFTYNVRVDPDVPPDTIKIVNAMPKVPGPTGVAWHSPYFLESAGAEAAFDATGDMENTLLKAIRELDARLANIEAALTSDPIAYRRRMEVDWDKANEENWRAELERKMWGDRRSGLEKRMQGNDLI